MTRAFLKFTAFLCAFFLIVSCQKELSGFDTGKQSGIDKIKGDWKFVTMDVKSTINYTGSLLGNSIKGITVADFITKNNAGLLKIDTSRLILTDLSYSIDTTATTSTYLNNFLIDTSVDAVVYDAPAVSTFTDYRLIGSDSMNFPNADFINLPPEFQLPPITGMKYKVDNDLLKFSTTLSGSGIDNSTGTDLAYTINAGFVITFRKQ